MSFEMGQCQGTLGVQTVLSYVCLSIHQWLGWRALQPCQQQIRRQEKLPWLTGLVCLRVGVPVGVRVGGGDCF